MQESDAKKPRGRSAIEAAHGNVTSEDESRLDLMISDLYEVDSDEAAEIHLNYHVDRMFADHYKAMRRKRNNNQHNSRPTPLP